MSEAKKRMTVAIPYIMKAINMAKKDYKTVGLAITGENPDGSGKRICFFEAEAFFADLKELIGLPIEDEEVEIPHGMFCSKRLYDKECDCREDEKVE